MRATYFLIFILSTYEINGYKIFYMEESGSCANHPLEITVGWRSGNSSGILKNAKDSTYSPHRNCTVLLRPSYHHGIVVSIRRLDLQPFSVQSEDCENYLEISPVEHHGFVKICGYSNDQYEYQSYQNWGVVRISFVTSNSTLQKKAEFQLTFTAVRRDHSHCLKDEQRCRNRNCIWNELRCDGHNNCGDLSDEVEKYTSHCAAMTPGESLAVILVTVISSLALLIIAAYLRGPKITRQIERLSQGQRTDCSPRTDAARNVPNYGSTNPPSTSRDLPPTYEEALRTATA